MANSTEKSLRIRSNGEITFREVRLVGDNVENGVYRLEEAMGIADSKGLDLVEISFSGMPICKVTDLSKFMFDAKKKQKELMSAQKENKQKEVQLSQNIDEHDYVFKRNNARGFLEKGNSVRVVMVMKGREMQYIDKSKAILTRMIGELSDCSTCEESLRPEGNRIIINIRPKKKQ